MKKIKMGVVLILLMLISCSNKNDEINIEEGLFNKLSDISLSMYVEKMENKDDFVVFFYSLRCSYCIDMMDSYLKSYIDEGNTIYGINVNKEKSFDELISYQEKDAPYIHFNQNQQIIISCPLIQFIEEGQIVKYFYGKQRIIF
ncbi:MAG: hypothetical protein PUA56_02160 [Bacillales bacterium]|nr:hypothetical protein [Bacillales bacterium]